MVKQRKQKPTNQTKLIERKISIERYIIAGTITLLIFALGLSMGFVLDYKRITWIEEQSKAQELDYQSLQLQYLYLNTIDDTEKSCHILGNTLQTTLITLSETLEDLEKFEKDTKLNKKEYNTLLRKFTINNLKYWLFAEKSKKLCNMDAVTLLYFFSRENCPICPNQGMVLSYFKTLLGEDLLVFPIDVDLKQNEPIIQLLESIYNIQSYPTIVIEDITYSRVVEKEELGKIICNIYNSPNNHCDKYLE
ncbi:hypothetical protein H8D83_00425 [Candidatus Woesearchaeota archaeon]|nr:hypothetical protein [Candidatus Woesearchaeota archaeon]MBL7050836.1 hypothetical protein [Candidatus Woesearchaeota archaeon]